MGRYQWEEIRVKKAGHSIYQQARERYVDICQALDPEENVALAFTKHPYPIFILIPFT